MQFFNIKPQFFPSKLRDFPPKLKDFLPKLKIFFLNSRIRQIHLLVKGQNRFRKACSNASFWVPERKLIYETVICMFFLRFLSSFSFPGRGVGSNALSLSQLMNKSASNPLNKSGSRYPNLSLHSLYPYM